MKRGAVLLAAAIAALLSMAAGVSLATDKDEQAKVGTKAPDFTLKDLDGKEHSLSDFEGKIVVLEWTNQKCPYVLAKHGDKTMQKLAAEYADDDVVWIAIDSSHYADRDSNKQYTKKMGIEYPFLHDTDGKVGRMYGAKTTPHMFVINKQGTLVYSGAIDNKAPGQNPDKPVNYVEAAVHALINGSAIETSESKPYGCSVKYAKK